MGDIGRARFSSLPGAPLPIRNDMWKVERCFILGSGPSMTGFDYSCLKDERVIGINRSYECFDSDILFACDNRFWLDVRAGKYGDEAKEKLTKYKGIKIGLQSLGTLQKDVIYLKNKGLSGVPISIEDGIYNGNNSGYCAIQLAFLLGAHPIYLLGFDMQWKDGKTHCHSGHPEKGRSSDFNNMLPSFEVMSKTPIGWRVVNLTRGSRMPYFRMGEMVITKEHKKQIYMNGDRNAQVQL